MTAPIRLGRHPTVLIVLLTCLQKLLPKLKKGLWLRRTAGACVKEDFCGSVLFLMWKNRKLLACFLLHSHTAQVSSYRPLLSTGLVIPPQTIT